MSRTITFYCSCSTCTQIRHEQPKYYRYFNHLRYLFTCSSCLPQRQIIFETPSTFSRISTITFRDTDITNKHCSKHDVMIKATRPNFSSMKNEELRQRVKDANQRWTRMSILPLYLIDFLLEYQSYLPLCSQCDEQLSSSMFNLCLTCIRNLINSHEQFHRHALPILSEDDNENHCEHYFIDYLSEESMSV